MLCLAEAWVGGDHPYASAITRAHLHASRPGTAATRHALVPGREVAKGRRCRRQQTKWRRREMRHAKINWWFVNLGFAASE